ncbi:MAG: molybdopterin-binding protein [Candidatus Thorarchaeota archaeon]
MNVCLISVGNELLSGKTINTNANFLAKKLTNFGFSVQKILTLPDDPKIVPNEISLLVSSGQYRLILITGGLGPTWDDSTANFLAKALDVNTEINIEALSIVTQRYKELFDKGLVDTAEITPARKKMAILPVGSETIDNPVGTAPGIFFIHKISNTWIFCLPGVPREMKEMYKAVESKISVLKNENQRGYYETEFTSSFTDESLLAPFLIQVRQKYDVWIKSLPEAYQEEKNIHLIISKLTGSEEDAKKEVLAAKAYLHKLINSTGNDR